MSLTKASYSMITGSPVNVLDWGADPTGTTDSYNAITNAIAAQLTQIGDEFMSPGVYFPPGKYLCSKTIELTTNQVKLFGNGSGLGPVISPIIKFTTAGCTGIYIAPYTTPDFYNAGGSIIQGLTLEGTTGTADTYGGHGIYSQSGVQIVNTVITGFQACGINITANLGGSGLNFGDANGWSIRDVFIGTNTSNTNAHGVYISGSDANAGNGYAVNVGGAGGNGIYDSSFLGNTWVGCEVVSTGAAYYCTGADARSVFLNCYSESGSGASNVTNPSMMILGLQGAGTTTNTLLMGTDSSGFNFNQITSVPQLVFGNGQPLTSGNGLLFADTSGVSGRNWTFSKTTGRWGFLWANIGSPGYIEFYDDTATPSNGYARDISSGSSPTGGYGALGIDNYYFGGSSQMKWRGLGTAAPSSGSYLVGDIIYNSAPTAGGYIGWVCTTAGSPGTWKTFGAISS